MCRECDVEQKIVPNGLPLTETKKKKEEETATAAREGGGAGDLIEYITDRVAGGHVPSGDTH